MKLANCASSVFFIFAGLAMGCGPSAGPGDDVGTPGVDGGAIGGPGADAGTPVGGDAGLIDNLSGCREMDILFVIDDSGSMGQEQGNLAANFPEFFNVINNFNASNGDPIDYRLAVTTTGVSKDITQSILGIPVGMSQSGPDGALIGSGCGLNRPWIERSDSTAANGFTCLATVGTSGADDEMPLEAMRLAIEDRVADGTNSEFFREDALLGIVMLTDENDCSRMDDDFDIGFGDSICDEGLEPVDTYLSALDAFKGERGRWATAVIAGLTNCSSDLGDAEQATRLIEFANQTGENAAMSSICEGDLAAALQSALETFDTACQTFPEVF